MTEQHPDSDFDFEIITEPDSLDALLSGEAATHFPNIHNRRKDDEKDEEVRRLRAVLHALDKGAGYPADGLEPSDPPLETQYYKQF